MKHQLQQCVFLWRKMQRAVVAKAARLDSNTLDPARGARCAEMLLERGEEEVGRRVMLAATFTTCGVEG